MYGTYEAFRYQVSVLAFPRRTRGGREDWHARPSDLLALVCSPRFPGSTKFDTSVRPRWAAPQFLASSSGPGPSCSAAAPLAATEGLKIFSRAGQVCENQTIS